MLQDCPIYAYLPAGDVARARRFYEDQLGLKPHEETAGGVVYRFANGTACFLYPTPNAGTSQASQFFWEVPDDGMPGDRSPQGAVIAGGAKAAWFRDSEGNILALIEPMR